MTDTTRIRLRPVLSIGLGIVLVLALALTLAFFLLSPPKVLGDFTLGKTTGDEAIKLLKAKPDCQFTDSRNTAHAVERYNPETNTTWIDTDALLHNDIYIERPQTCGYNFPGQTGISLRSNIRSNE